MSCLLLLKFFLSILLFISNFILCIALLTDCVLFAVFHFSFFLWLCWISVAARGLSLAAVSWRHFSLPCMGFSLQWLLLLWSTGSRHASFSSCQNMGSVLVHGIICSAACGIFLNQGLDPCALHWQANS